jgi:hypothetical protein
LMLSSRVDKGAVLASALVGLLESGTSTFVLIDPLLGEPIPVEQVIGIELPGLTQVREQGWMRPVHIIKLAQTIALPLHQHPYLVELQGRDDPQLAETMEIACEELAQTWTDGLASSGAAPHRIGGWLQSSSSSDELTRALGAMMSVNTQAITPARYQRLADRRALSWLRQVVGDEGVTKQFGRIQSWHYLDTCGKLACLHGAGETTTSLRLTHSEWALFIRGELLHPTVARWLGERSLRPKSGDTTTPDERACYLQASAALERAEAAARRWPQRFAKPSDRVAWAALTLLHPGIEQSPEVATALDAPTASGEPIETLDALSPMLSVICLKAT